MRHWEELLNRCKTAYYVQHVRKFKKKHIFTNICVPANSDSAFNSLARKSHCRKDMTVLIVGGRTR